MPSLYKEQRWPNMSSRFCCVRCKKRFLEGQNNVEVCKLRDLFGFQGLDASTEDRNVQWK